MGSNKRSTFLVNPSFQLRVSFILAAGIFLISLLYPLVFMNFMNDIVEIHPEITDTMMMERTKLLFFLVPIQLLLAFLAFIFTIFMTHRIAGPLFKLKSHLSAIRHGEERRPLNFREGDLLHDVSEEVSLFLESLDQNQESDFKYLDEVAVYIENLSSVIPEDKRPVLNEISRRLMDIQNRYKKDL